MNQPNKERFKTSVGGQALIEGIMMRGPKNICCAVRKPDGTIETKVEPTPHPRRVDKDPAGAGRHLDDREPHHGLPLHDVLGTGEHGGRLRPRRRGDRL